MAELVDAHDSKSCGSNVMGVRFPPSVHIEINASLKLIEILICIAVLNSCANRLHLALLKLIFNFSLFFCFGVFLGL